ncbi:MAG TPA: TRAP transporter TatT component family protein [Thermoanaerobaculia bacterium]|nr:TRAP transporter TatT component family protein [Thermoanaerobaculia bacterium]
MPRQLSAPPATLALLVPAALLLGGCSLRGMAVRAAADALAGSGTVYASDPDPELVGEALPFALKTMESLLAQDPGHQGLLLATAQGFTQYAYGWVQLPAERLAEEDYERSQQLGRRALDLFLRARDYALRGLEADHPGIGDALRRDPEAAVARLGEEDLPLAYWAGLSWGAAMGVGKDRPELLADFPAVRALLARVLALDEGYEEGAVHEAFIAIEAGSRLFGGTLEAAEEHFRRAVELSRGRRAGPYVTYAQAVAVPRQDRDAYLDMLERALAVDVDAAPEHRLANVLAQRKAVWLRLRVDDYFLGAAGDDEAGAATATEDAR